MNNKAILALTFAATLGGCASSSGVFKVGPDSYRVTSSAITSFGGAGTARGAGIKKAQAHCASLGKTATVTDATTEASITQGTSDVTFKCE